MTARAPRPSPAVCESLIADQGYECPECMGPLSFDLLKHYEVDHIVPLALGGSNDISNLRVLHKACHRRIKTPADIKMISKADSQGKTHTAHLEAMRTGTRRLSKRKILKLKLDERRKEVLAPRQD